MICVWRVIDITENGYWYFFGVASASCTSTVSMRFRFIQSATDNKCFHSDIFFYAYLFLYVAHMVCILLRFFVTAVGLVYCSISSLQSTSNFTSFKVRQSSARFSAIHAQIPFRFSHTLKRLPIAGFATKEQEEHPTSRKNFIVRYPIIYRYWDIFQQYLKDLSKKLLKRRAADVK